MLLSLFLVLVTADSCQSISDTSRNMNLNVGAEDLKLTRLDPVFVGYDQPLYLQSGRTLTIKTAAVNPPIFEIENFLADHECEYLKNIAEKKHWEESVTVPKEEFRRGAKEGDHRLHFKTADKNNDNFVDFLELWYKRPPVQNSYITVEDIPEFIQLYHYDVDGDSKLTAEEFNKIDVKLMYEWMYKKMETDKKKHGRVSNQVWVRHDSDDIFSTLQERVVSLTGLSKRMVDASETMQIVHYDVGGHYHAHYDTGDTKTNHKCIHTRQIDGVGGDAPLDYTYYRLCRFATIMYYLTDVDEGGETAFPVADNATVSTKVLFDGGSMGDLSNHCQDARLVVKPKKGKAVMWYNHLLNDEDWVGSRDDYSLHGGCDIKRGVKWIANHWLTVDTVKERQIRYMNFREKTFYGGSQQQRHRGIQDEL